MILNGFLVSEKSASSIVQPSSVVDVPVSLITCFLEFPHFVHALRKVTLRFVYAFPQRSHAAYHIRLFPSRLVRRQHLKKILCMFSIINKSRFYLTLTIHTVRTLPNLSLETSSSWSACKYSFESGPTRSAGFGLVELRDPIDEYPRLYKEQ